MFTTDDAVASAWRLCAVLDGLGLQVVLHHGTMTRAQMHEHVRTGRRAELGSELRPGALTVSVGLPPGFQLVGDVMRFDITLDGQVFSSEVTGVREGPVWRY